MKNKANKEIIKVLEKEINTLVKEIESKEFRLKMLQKLIDEFKNYESLETNNKKYEELNGKYEREKERLVKLHFLYKKIESDNIELKEELNNWQQWFKDHSDLLNKLFTNAPVGNIQKNQEKSKSNKQNKKSKKSKKLSKKKSKSSPFYS